MARGTVFVVNRAMQRPILMAGVEKRLALLNALIAFVLIAPTHFHFPACFVGMGVYMVLHGFLMLLARYDPHFGKILKRATRYAVQSYFPAHAHPLQTEGWSVRSVTRPS